jgi:FkbM family methyltransferase
VSEHLHVASEHGTIGPVADARAPSERVSLSGRIVGRVGNVSRRLPNLLWKNRIGRALAYCLGDPPAVPARFGGLTIWMRPASRSSSEAFWSGAYEQDFTDFLMALLEPGWVVADVGANLGLVGLPLGDRLRSLGSGKVLLFEPVPANNALLRRSLAENALQVYAQLFEVGLADHRTTAIITVEGRPGRSGNAVLQAPSTGHHQGTDVLIELDCLDDVLACHGQPNIDLVKVDVEGAEVAFLRGALATVDRCRPIIFGEFHSGLMPLHGTAFPDAIELLAPFEYRILAFKGRLHLVEVDAEPGRGDVVLVPHRRLAHFVERTSECGIQVELRAD